MITGILIAGMDMKISLVVNQMMDPLPRHHMPINSSLVYQTKTFQQNST